MSSKAIGTEIDLDHACCTVGQSPPPLAGHAIAPAGWRQADTVGAAASATPVAWVVGGLAQHAEAAL